VIVFMGQGKLTGSPVLLLSFYPENEEYGRPRAPYRIVHAMAGRPPTSLSLLLFHFVVAVFCLWNVMTIPERAIVPFGTVLDDEKTYVSRITDEAKAGGVQQRDLLVSWKTIPIAMPQHLELLADLSAIGDRVPLTISREGEMLTRTVELVPFYPSFRFAVVTAVVGMTILLFGLFVYLKRPGDPTALLLYWSLMALGTVTMMTQGAVEPDSMVSFTRRGLLFVSYNMTAVFFVMFSMQFPRRILSSPRVTFSVLIAAHEPDRGT